MPVPNLSQSYAEAAFKMELVDLANRIRPTLNGSFDQVKALIDDAEIAIAVWQDPFEPDGVGLMPVKGAQHLRDIISSEKAKELSITAIPCICIEQAVALRQVVADHDPRH